LDRRVGSVRGGSEGGEGNVGNLDFLFMPTKLTAIGDRK
jgi:hypothetical protein